MPDLNWQLITPDTDSQWQAYFNLRWQVLRAPWNQPPGSEKDHLESTAIHRMIADEQGQALAVGRLHLLDALTGQIRYMAVAEQWRNKQLGSAILESLETHASNSQLTKIILDARENAVGFYQRHGYEVIAEGHTLYGEIPHMKMQKILSIIHQ